ncbi:MAG: drug/metabolite exporter YedA [Gemmatimonadota bacterium]
MPARLEPAEPATRRLHLFTAFAAIYLIWGSTYLAIRFAIETLPPLVMAGARFTLAGAAVYAWVRLRGAPRPTRDHWMATAPIGFLLLTVGNGGLAWAEQRVPSGSAALIVAIMPLWIVLFDWLWYNGPRPTRRVLTGITLGFAGIVLLVGPEELAGAGRIDALGALVIVIGSLAWAGGSLHSRQVRLPASPWLATAMEMLAGGILLLVVATLRGEWALVELSEVSMRSAVSLAYLAVFGSIVAFSAYIWLLRVITPARVATHTFVNPAVAVLLGWALANEPLTPRMLAATGIIIIGAVVVITSRPVGASLESGELA